MKKISFTLVFLLSFWICIGNVDADYSIKNGTYIIKSALDNNQVIDVLNANAKDYANVQLYHNNLTDAQKWIVTYKDGHYTITSALDNNMAIDIFNGKKNNRSNIQLYHANGTDAQKWNIKHVGNSLFEIISSDGKYCIDINNGTAFSGNNIQLYECNHTSAQKFKFVELVEADQTVEDGLYTIASALDEKQVLDVYNGLSDVGTNVQLYHSNLTKAQRWNIKYLGDGYYSIISRLNDNRCLDVSGGIFVSGSNVQLYHCNQTDAQKWIIKDVGDGYYQILTKVDPTPLDVSNGVAKDWANIQIYHNNLTDAQKFKLIKIDEKKLESGTYTIKSNLDKSKVLDVAGGYSYEDTNVHLYHSNKTNAQVWYLSRLENGYYTIKSGLNSNNYLSYKNNSSGSNVLVTTKLTEWKLEYIDENLYYIISKDNGLYLNLENSATADWTNINILTSNQSEAQKFYFEKTDINQNSPTISDGFYTINSKLNINKAIDVDGGSKVSGTNIQLYDANNSNAQVWYFKYLDNGYYSINSALNTNTSMDLYNGSISDGTNVQLYHSNNTDAQIWKLKDDGNGSISIISKKSDICLTINNGSISNKTNIQANNCNYQDNQKFKLTRFTDDLIYTGIDVSEYQGTIDWAKVSSSNIGFVILRLGIGDNWTSQDDLMFEKNVAGCEKYNIPYGVYLYSYAKNVDGSTALNANSESASSEAYHVLRLLDKVSYKPNLATSVYIDMEESTLEYLGKNKLTSIADKFCSIIENNGYGCGIYANKSWLNNYLDAKSLAKKYDIWIAEWTSNSTSPSYSQAINLKPSYSLTDYKLWQFSSKGNINGIKGYIDVDLGYNIFK